VLSNYAFTPVLQLYFVLFSVIKKYGKENDVDEACNAHRVDEKCVQDFSWASWRDKSDALGVAGG
jgi:hypothetical protein